MGHLSRLHALIVALAIVWPGVAGAGLQEGLDALRTQDFATAAQELRPLAERGNPEAQYRIGLMYEHGKGYPQNKGLAVLWLRKSADQGHAAAQTELGILYSTGDGIAQDDSQAAAWSRKGAEQGNPFAQYNIGLFYAKGQGVPRDDAQAIAWFRKAADQGLTIARYKLGLAYEFGEGVKKDPVRAYANYAIAARDGSADAATHRDALAGKLTPAQLRDANAIVAQSPVPASAGAAGGKPPAAGGGAPAPDKCSATGTMEGEKFAATHCVASVYGDQHSVAIWFSEDPIAPADADSFRLSSYADGSKGGKPRTQVTIMFCPGGGAVAAAPAAVHSIDFSTNHAKSPMAGVQWVIESPKDFKVEKMTGEAAPGGRVAGRIVGSRAKSTWTLDFDLGLPTKEAAAGMACKK
jgi:TPR repeat protein